MLIERLWVDVGKFIKNDKSAMKCANGLGWKKPTNRASKLVYVCQNYDYCDLVIVLRCKNPQIDYVYLVDKELVVGKIEYLKKKIRFEKEHNADSNADKVLYIKEDTRSRPQPAKPFKDNRAGGEECVVVTRDGLETLLRLYHGTFNIHEITDLQLVTTRALADAWTLDIIRDAMDSYFKTYKLNQLKTMCTSKALAVDDTEEKTRQANIYQHAAYVIGYMNNLGKNVAQFGSLLEECVEVVRDLLHHEVVKYVVQHEADRHFLIPLLYPEIPAFVQPKRTVVGTSKKQLRSQRRKRRIREKSAKLDADPKKPKVAGSDEPSSDAPPKVEVLKVNEGTGESGQNSTQNAVEVTADPGPTPPNESGS